MNDAQTAFVEAVIWDNINMGLSAYHPLVIDAGTQPLAAPVVPVFAAGATVGIWFGFNGNNLLLTDNGAGSLQAGVCVNGATINGILSIFGQFSYCNAIGFFAVVVPAVTARTVVPPPPALGIAADGAPCPTVWDFSLVDMDPVDNVVTTYIVNLLTGQSAQNTTTNIMNIGLSANVVYKINPSDNRLVTGVDAALGCSPWKIRNQDDQGFLIATLATNQLHALLYQAAPIAYVVLSDPMTKFNNGPSLPKVNAYRQGVAQPIAGTAAAADSFAYCVNFYNIHPKRLLKNLNIMLNSASPNPAVADSMLTFMAQRFNQAFGANNLNCVDVLRVNNPINITLNGNGLAVGAVIVPGTYGATSTLPTGVTTGAASSPFVSVAIVLLMLAGLLF